MKKANRKTPFTAVNITFPARDALRTGTATAGTIGRKVSMSDYLIAAIAVAERHRDELIAELTEPADEPLAKAS